MSASRLDVEIVGKGRDLVLLHSLLSDRTSFEPLAASLTGTTPMFDQSFVPPLFPASRSPSCASNVLGEMTACAAVRLMSAATTATTTATR